MAGNRGITLKKTDRPLLILNDYSVWGSTRVQKYGFLLRMLHKQEMAGMQDKYEIAFYDDWAPLWYGPYSRSLQQDLESCINAGTIVKLNLAKLKREKPDVYQFTVKGRVRWRYLFRSMPEIATFAKMVESLQKVPYYTLLNRIYSGWPEFTTKSRIRRDVAARAKREPT